jgi:hypothetical protein
MMSDVYSRSPVNKTAALVTGQNGCGNGSLTQEQIRENLVLKLKSLKTELQAAPKGSAARRDMAGEQRLLEKAIREIRPKMKGKGAGEHFIAVCREEMTKYQFDTIMTKAANRMRAEEIRRKLACKAGDD